MRKEINYDSYKDSGQARHLKSWINQHSAQQKTAAFRNLARHILRFHFDHA